MVNTEVKETGRPAENSKPVRCEIFHDNFENSKVYNIPRAQMIIADIPFALGDKMYASNPMWYKDGDNKNGESSLAHKAAFDRDYSFNINKLLRLCYQTFTQRAGEGRERRSLRPDLLFFRADA